MITFLSILFTLLAINALLLIFSVNGAREMFKKPIRKISEVTTLRISTRQYPESKYKEAV
ncbi:MAG: hypothetical protein AAGB24_11930 [Bacteroidota bacterium]